VKKTKTTKFAKTTPRPSPKSTVEPKKPSIPHPLQASGVAPTEAQDAPEDPRIQGTPDQRTEAAHRAQACTAKINAALTEFRCRLVPVIDPPEPVGTEPVRRIIITASYGIMPEV